MTPKEKQKRTRTRSQEVKELQAAWDYGIDVSMLIRNLARSPAERIRRHQIALDTSQKLREARRL